MLKILKDGDRFGIITDHDNIYLLIAELSKELARISESGRFENDLEFQFEYIFSCLHEIFRYFQSSHYPQKTLYFGSINSGMVVL